MGHPQGWRHDDSYVLDEGEEDTPQTVLTISDATGRVVCPPERARHARHPPVHVEPAPRCADGPGGAGAAAVVGLGLTPG